jgi:Rieske Fe-S protein
VILFHTFLSILFLTFSQIFLILELVKLQFLRRIHKDLAYSVLLHQNGLIIYRIGIDEFAVYDITCTFKASTDFCALEMDDTWLIPKCPCCGSEFNILLEASPVSGPAASALKQYYTFIRNNQLYIKN